MSTSIRVIRESFSGCLPKNSRRLDFLDAYTYQGDSIFVHGDTGVISSGLTYSSNEILDYWSNAIFTSNSNDDYSAFFPFARARLYYVQRTLLDYLESLKKTGSLRLCDFAAGEGVLANLFKRDMPGWDIRCTEGSKALSERLVQSGFATSNCILGEGQLDSFKVDIGVLTWTLCNCIRPLDVLLELRNNIDEDGFLVVADSSRILVPFKKSLRDLFNANHPADIHPFFFSAKSLAGLLIAAGFQPVFYNRFKDSDILLIIAKRLEELPPDDFLVPSDDALDVISFLRLSHDLTPTFDSWST